MLKAFEKLFANPEYGGKYCSITPVRVSSRARPFQPRSSMLAPLNYRLVLSKTAERFSFKGA